MRSFLAALLGIPFREAVPNAYILGRLDHNHNAANAKRLTGRLTAEPASG
jgi:hypothetical protein